MAQDITGALAMRNGAASGRNAGEDCTTDWTRSGNGQRNVAGSPKSRQDLAAVIMEKGADRIDALPKESLCRIDRCKGMRNEMANAIYGVTAQADHSLRRSADRLSEGIEALLDPILNSTSTLGSLVRRPLCTVLNSISAVGYLLLHEIDAGLNPADRIKPTHWNLHQFQGNADMASQCEDGTSNAFTL